MTEGCMINEEVQTICARLYFGWVEKSELPQMEDDTQLYREVQRQLYSLGLELIDRPECPWYVVRLLREFDSFETHYRRYKILQGPHLALLLILYAKLLLPRRTNQVSFGTELSVTFQELYQSYGHRFIPMRRRTTSETTLRKLLHSLLRLGFIVKPRGKDHFLAGPSMYMLHEELLSDLAEACLHLLYGKETEEMEEMEEMEGDDEAEPELDHKGESN